MSTVYAQVRRFPRYPIDVRVAVISMRAGSLFRSLVRSHELSEGGMSVVSPLELPMNEAVEVEFTLPGSRMPLRVKALVRNRKGSRYGIEYLSLTDAQKADIRAAGEAVLANKSKSF